MQPEGDRLSLRVRNRPRIRIQIIIHSDEHEKYVFVIQLQSPQNFDVCCFFTNDHLKYYGSKTHYEKPNHEHEQQTEETNRFLVLNFYQIGTAFSHICLTSRTLTQTNIKKSNHVERSKTDMCKPKQTYLQVAEV